MKFLNLLLVLVPIVLILELTDTGGHTVVFVTSALAMIPLAALLGQATEEVAEHLVAVKMALRNKMDLSLAIALGSSLQVALFVTPVLVFVGILVDHKMSLVFSSFELAALIGAPVIAMLISVDGRSNWLEGAQLISVYFMIGLAFYLFRDDGAVSSEQ